MTVSGYDAALAAARQTFFIEAGEMLEQLEQSLLTLEDEGDSPDLLNALFRSVHTIKGSAGLFGLDRIVHFTHEVETLLDELRGGRQVFDRALGALLLRCRDQIAELLEAARDEADESHLDAASNALLAEVTARLGRNSASTLPKPAGPTPAGHGGHGHEEEGAWHISLRFNPDCHERGIDPLATIRYLTSLGEVELIETVHDVVPTLSEIDPERCYLGFEIRLSKTVDRQKIEEAFEFIEGDCRVEMIQPGASVKDYIDLINNRPEDSDRLGEILVECGALSRADLHRALAIHHLDAIDGESFRPLGQVLVEQNMVQAAVVDAAIKKQASSREKTEEARFFRISADKVDSLIDLVGELVISSATARVQATGLPELLETTQHIERVVAEIRNSTLALRMVAIGETFTRFRRVVRDLSEELGKSVQLELEGADTELDKTVVEKIGDPLMHLVRNAMDHGIETSAEREANGKPASATLRLSARHESGNIVIAVGDDGRGINTARVLQKAQERGLVPVGAVLSEQEIHQLIFEPGFSTAEKVTDISGRGVGMDVVRQNVEKLRGRIGVHSQIGKGATIEISLPLTLAIIDGFLVRSGNAALVIPLEYVEECIAAGSLELHDGYAIVEQRGEPLPVMDIAHRLGLRRRPAEGRRSIVVVRAGAQRIGLLVEKLLGEHQTVIKPLGKVFAGIQALSGSTILGTGEVALILDIPNVITVARQAGQATVPKLSHTTAS